MSMLPPEILELRRRGHGGGRIEPHRAFRRIADRKRISWSAVALVALLTASIIVLLPAISLLWQKLLALIVDAVGMAGRIGLDRRSVLPFVHVDVPYIVGTSRLPGRGLLQLTIAGYLAMLVVSLLLPRKHLPLIYMLRLALIILGVSLIYFAVWGERFPYTLERYTLDMLTVGLSIISLLPVLYGLTYFVFDFGVARKLFIVAITTLHLVIFIPIQFALHAAIVEAATLLFLPLLFMMFGLLLDVSVVIAFYGWAMSWRDRSERIAQPWKGLNIS
jgi:hypothetical protein